jgi:hypothetical protein
MVTLRRLLVLSALIAAGSAGAASVGTAATPPPSKYKVKTRIAKLQVDVAGYVETRLLHDTTSDCFPGERWIQTNRFTFETGNYVNLSINNISAPGIPSVTTSPFSRVVGTAKVAGAISDYESTNYCNSAPQKLEGAPECRDSSGKIAVALTPGDVPDEEDDLTPLRGKPLSLTIRRAGAGRDAARCFGNGASSVTGKDAKLAVVGTSPLPGIAEILPANLDAIKVFAIRKNQRIKRAIVIQGPCSKVRVTAGPPPGATPSPGGLNADGDCWLIGKVVLTIRSRR